MRARRARSRFSSVARTASVLVLGTFGLHQLNYLLLHGDQAGAALARDGHGYLTAFAPALIVIALALLASSVAVGLAERRVPVHGATSATRESSAAILAVAFLALFLAQELLEGAFAAGHPHGFDALAQSWIALPLALPVGAFAALGLAGVRRAEQLLAAPARWFGRGRPTAFHDGGGARPEPRLSLICLPLPFGLVRRGPPRVALA